MSAGSRRISLKENEFDLQLVTKDVSDATEQPLLVRECFADGSSEFPNVNRRDLFAYVKNALRHLNADNGKHAVSGCAQLTSRDIRKLVASFYSPSEASFVVRQHVLLVDLDPVRAIVLRDRCLLLLQNGADEMLGPFVDGLHVEEHHGMEFEFLALEAVLASLVIALDRQCTGHTRERDDVVKRLRGSTETSILEKLRQVKDEVGEFAGRVGAMHALLVRMIDDEHDLAYMHLTELHEHPDMFEHVEEFEHEDAETLLESVIAEVGRLARQAHELTQSLEDSEHLMELQLAAQARSLLFLRTVLTLAVIALTVVTAVSAVFGLFMSPCMFSRNVQLNHTTAHNMNIFFRFREGWFNGVNAADVSLAIGLSFTVFVLLRHCGVFNV